MTAIAEIDAGAFRRNLQKLSALVAPTPVMAMVKADAYGHGMVVLAREAVAAGCEWLGCLEISAALELRDAGIAVRLFAWLHGQDADFAAAAAQGVDVGVTAAWQLEAIARAKPPRPLRIHLKIDSGLHRNGIPPEEWEAAVRRALDLERSGVVEITGIWSHLADAGYDNDRDALAELLAAVDRAAALGARPRVIHLAASSAGIREPETRLDLVRFGIAAYGISPFDDETGLELGLEPVMTVKSTVVGRADNGVIQAGAGFADGIVPDAGPEAEVLVAGKRARILSVDVDTCAIASDAPHGSEVVFFGAPAGLAPHAEEWASWAGTIGDEIVTRIAVRVPRVTVNATPH